MAKPLFEDTDEQTERRLIELTRAMPEEKKLRLLFSMIETGRQLGMAGLQSRYPQASPDELKKRYAALVLDRETVMKVYGWDPEEEGY
ncbi:MAG: hypothetical protein HY231_18475 [Acidobacteria bacterium]|nr:hypothetical protein [Acidobacteriota bacterium]